MEFFETWLSQMNRTHFYPMSPTCQMPQLALEFERLFGRKNDGVFVEVGAYDGHTFSNTAGLADIGWRGIYVEPVLDYANVCATRHHLNKVEVLNFAVGPTEGVLNLAVGLAYTTGNFDNLEACLKDDLVRSVFKPEQVSVNQVRLDQILEYSKIEPGFDLLVIDVEGMEEGVMAGFDLAHYRPTAMLIELTDQCAPLQSYQNLVDSHSRVRARILDSGYNGIEINDANTLFIRID